MQILMVLPRYDYGREGNGFSQDELYLVRSLKAMGVTVDVFDYPTLIEQQGQQVANEMLRTQFTYRDYDMVVYIPFLGHEIYEETWVYGSPKTAKVLWIFNDVWRFNGFGNELCWNFDWVVTDDPKGPENYKELGFGERVVYLPRAIHTKWFTDNLSDDKPIDVCFIGQAYGYRSELIMNIVKALPDSTNIMLGGLGGPRVSWNQYVETMCQSKIVLSPSMASKGETFQTKTRTIEGMSAGALVLTDNLGDVDFSGKTAQFFDKESDAVTFINFHLADSDGLKVTIQKAQDYAVANHDYRNRFETLFERLGLKCQK